MDMTKNQVFELLPYQKDGVDWLASKNHAVLCDQMGLGKTPQAICAAQKIGAKKILVLCPSVAKYNWQNELLKFANLKSKVIEGRPLGHMKGIAICSYNNVTDYLSAYKKTNWDLVIADEWHFLKEPTAQRTKAVLGSSGILHNTKRLWGLTGTPAPNHAGEIWTTLYTFGLTKISYDGFIARYCHSHRDGSYYARVQITGTNTARSPEIKSMLKKIGLRRLKKDVLKDLPPIRHEPYFVKEDFSLEFPKEFMEKLKLELSQIQEKLGTDLKDIPDDKLLSALGFFSQSISSLRRYHGLKKVYPVADVLRSELEAKAYKKIVIFGIHTDVLSELEGALIDFSSVKITGQTPPKDRQLAVERFQNDPECQIFYGNIQAAGTAITLTAADQVGFIEQDWVPGNNAQAADRLHRIGQRNAVSARYFAIKDSLDEKITATLTRKVREISTFID